MWVRMKNGQEVDADPFHAQLFIDNGEAVAIKTPAPKAQPAFDVKPVAPKFQPVPWPVEVRKIVQDLGLANQPQSYQFIKRFLDTEARVAELYAAFTEQKKLQADFAAATATQRRA